MSTNSEYITQMAAQLQKWDSDIDELRSRGKQMATQLRAGYFGRIKELRAHRDEAQKRFQEIRCASDDAADKLHAGMEGAWQAMKNGLDEATADLRQ